MPNSQHTINCHAVTSTNPAGKLCLYVLFVCLFVLLAGIHSLTDSPVCLSTNRIFAYYRVVSKGKILLVQGRFPLSPLKEATQELLGESEANGASLQLGHGGIEEAIKVMESDVGVYKGSPVVKIEYIGVNKARREGEGAEIVSGICQVGQEVTKTCQAEGVCKSVRSWKSGGGN